MPRRRSPIAAVALAVLALACTSATASAADCAGADAEPAVQGLAAAGGATICLINQERTSDGLRPVTLNPQLTQASADYADLLVARSFFAHETPEGVDLVTRLTASGYLGESVLQWSVGENLAWGQGPLATPRQIVAAWMASPGHRRNILDGGFAEIGIGVTSGTPTAGVAGATYTTDFGTRTLAAPATPAAAPVATTAAKPKTAATTTAARRPARGKSRGTAAARRARAARLAARAAAHRRAVARAAAARRR